MGIVLAEEHCGHSRSPGREADDFMLHCDVIEGAALVVERALAKGVDSDRTQALVRRSGIRIPAAGSMTPMARCRREATWGGRDGAAKAT